MKRCWWPIAFLLISSTIFFILTSPVYKIRDKYASDSISGIGRLPSTIVQILTLEFKGVAADILLLKTMVFMGMKIGEHANPTDEEWQIIVEMLEIITDLDKKFWDPYVFAEMMLPWQAGKFDETNRLLLKAAGNIIDDYRPYYFLGFNHFYFENKSEQAAEYLRKAALIPGAPDYLKGLASRYSLYGNQTTLGIGFLADLIENTSDEQVKQYLGKRLDALKVICFLENKVKEFSEKYHSFPAKIENLVQAGIIEEVPEDPYGGSFVILENGRVYTTSNLVKIMSDKEK